MSCNINFLYVYLHCILLTLLCFSIIRILKVFLSTSNFSCKTSFWKTKDLKFSLRNSLLARSPPEGVTSSRFKRSLLKDTLGELEILSGDEDAKLKVLVRTPKFAPGCGLVLSFLLAVVLLNIKYCNNLMLLFITLHQL